MAGVVTDQYLEEELSILAENRLNASMKLAQPVGRYLCRE